MNETIKTLKNRISVKKYTDQQVPDDLLDAVLEAGLYAPSGMNNQKVICVAVRDKETRDLLAKLNTEIRGADSDMFYGAPCVIVVLSDPERNTWVEDGSQVLGNLMNAAQSLGLCSCWIHRAKEVFETQEGKQILASLGIEGEYEGIGNCILGYSAADSLPKAPDRKENYVYYLK